MANMSPLVLSGFPTCLVINAISSVEVELQVVRSLTKYHISTEIQRYIQSSP